MGEESTAVSNPVNLFNIITRLPQIELLNHSISSNGKSSHVRIVCRVTEQDGNDGQVLIELLRKLEALTTSS
jgi:hypothetical protein